MEKSGFFDAVYDESTSSYDLEYFADEFAKYFSMFVGSGVFGTPTNQLRVLAQSGMNVVVRPGAAFIRGYWYTSDEDIVIPISQNLTASTRKDSIVCRWDNSKRKISTVYQVGTTDIMRSDTFYDLKLAEIEVPSRTEEISNAFITDTRTNESVCGLVTHILRVETTKDLFEQYQAVFNEWFETVQGQVTGDLAAKLQLEFNNIEQSFQNIVNDFSAIQNEFDEVLARPVIQLSTQIPTSIPENTIVFVYE